MEPTAALERGGAPAPPPTFAFGGGSGGGTKGFGELLVLAPLLGEGDLVAAVLRETETLFIVLAEAGGEALGDAVGVHEGVASMDAPKERETEGVGATDCVALPEAVGVIEVDWVALPVGLAEMGGVGAAVGAGRTRRARKAGDALEQMLSPGCATVIRQSPGSRATTLTWSATLQLPVVLV